MARAAGCALPAYRFRAIGSIHNPQSKIRNQTGGIRGPAWQAQPGLQGAGAAAAGDFSALPTPISPKPPEITRRTGSPVSGCFVRGASFMLCTNSKRRGEAPSRGRVS